MTTLPSTRPITAHDLKRAHTMVGELRTKYGPGWDYMSPDQQANAVAYKVLTLLVAQDAPEYAAAQDLVMRMKAAVEASQAETSQAPGQRRAPR